MHSSISHTSIAAQNVRDRHELLLITIGTFKEENSAYQKVNFLSWALPLTILIHAIVDALIAYVYMKYAHPWRGILADNGNNDRGNCDEDETNTSVGNNSQEVHKGESKSMYNNFNLEI